jgi:hypothetical protein
LTARAAFSSKMAEPTGSGMGISVISWRGTWLP